MFAIEAACVAGELAVAGDDAVAGEDDGERVASVGGSDGAGGGGLVEVLGELAVGAGGAVGEGGAAVPAVLWAGGAVGGEGEVEGLALAIEVFGELLVGLLEEGEVGGFLPV